MIIGNVVNAIDATIEIEAFDSNDRPTRILALIDTGFTGQLTLPPETIARLSLSSRGTRSALLADGRIAVSRAFVGRISWDGVEKRVQILEAAGPPLIGMHLLRGFRLHIDVESNGRVLIEPLEPDGH